MSDAIPPRSVPLVFSGMTPSGSMSLGNYLGALRGWGALQGDHECWFSLVDLHAVTRAQQAGALTRYCLDFLALVLAAGISSETSTIFIQSHVPAHAGLAWILGCQTQLGELDRMTQYKRRRERYPENINLGLYSYPVLMAADILLYRANLVPVGEDQRQHLELARSLARRFNHSHEPIFCLPEPIVPRIGSRIMDIADPRVKMSKAGDPKGTIYLLDSPAAIAQKVQAATTDSESTVRFDVSEKPGVSNLLTIFAAVTRTSIENLVSHYRASGYKVFKRELADALIAELEPLQARFRDLRGDEDHLRSIFRSGALRARERSDETLTAVHSALGFVSRG